MDFVKNNWNITWNTTDSGITLSCDGNNTISSASDMNDLNTPPGFKEEGVPLVVAYCVMFVIAAAGNLSVIITLFRSKRHRRSRISLMICHLAVADLIVAFFMIPLEIGWRLTVEWKAGNVACKLFLFIRAFCLYLSSNVLVCVSLDRCFAVIYPLRVTDARRRGKSMLMGAWIIAILNALPQSVFFQVQVHPKFPGFRQCVTFESFSNSPALESAYNWFCLIAMYFVPLLIISIAYSAIVCEISNRSNRQHNDGDSGDNDMSTNGTVMLRCNALSQIQRARQRTFRLTITIVVGFIWCWTPYVVMASWYIIDKESAARVNPNVQDGLFLMAVSNSCLNPLIYSTYSMRRRCRFPWIRKHPPVGCKTELQRRSTDAGLADAKHVIERQPGKIRQFYNFKIITDGDVPSLNHGILCQGTISRTSVLSKLTNARTNAQTWKKQNVINEVNQEELRYNNERNKSRLLLDENGLATHNKHHHHSAKNLSNSQHNSVSNTNSRNGECGGNDDYDDKVSGSGRTPAIVWSSEPKELEDKGSIGGKRSNSFYCIRVGEMVTMHSQSSINRVSARPSFYSDPIRQYEWNGDLKTK